jgi:uncharacterized membrane protein HdeD (DUF308 family)
MNESSQAIETMSRRGKLWGILTILIGMIALASPLASGLVFTMMVAIVLLVAGISMTIYAFQASSLGRGILKFLFGGLTIIIALVMLSEPGIALAKLTLFLGVYFIVDGIIVLAGSLSVKPKPGWGWMAFNGAVTLLLAWLILEGWPLSGAWAIGVLVGVRLLFSGMTMLALGSAGSQATNEMSES